MPRQVCQEYREYKDRKHSLGRREEVRRSGDFNGCNWVQEIYEGNDLYGGVKY